MKRRPILCHVARRHIPECNANEEGKHDDFDGHHDGIEARGFADAPDEDHGERHDDAKGEYVEDDGDAKEVGNFVQKAVDLGGRAIIDSQPLGQFDTDGV